MKFDPRTDPDVPKGMSVELLQDLHLLTRDGHLNADARRKLKQIRHLVGLLRPALDDALARHADPLVVDCGAGKSYLGAMLYELVLGPAGRGSLTAIEARPELSARAAERAARFGQDRFRVATGSIGSFIAAPPPVADASTTQAADGSATPQAADASAASTAATTAAGGSATPQAADSSAASTAATPATSGSATSQVADASATSSAGTMATSAPVPRPHVVTALHACDTATDDALVLAIAQGADHVAVVPCCQAEVARQLESARAADPVDGALYAHPLHRRELGSHLTNVIRALVLEAHGYKVTVTELVGWEHSAKNELILGKRVQRYNKHARTTLRGLLDRFRVEPALVRELTARGLDPRAEPPPA